MNIKLILKCLVIIAVLILLVILGLDNPEHVALIMPRFATRQPAGLMYIAFFGIGFLVGAVLMTGGGGKKSGSSGGGSAGKSGKDK
jgi:uncharacterized integral membrane protein